MKRIIRSLTLLFLISCAVLCACGSRVNGEDIAAELNSKEEISAFLETGTFKYVEDWAGTDAYVFEFTSEDIESSLTDETLTVSEVVGLLSLDSAAMEHSGQEISFGPEQEIWNLYQEMFETLSKAYSDEYGKTIRIIITSKKDDGEKQEVLACENGEIVVNEFDNLGE